MTTWSYNGVPLSTYGKVTLINDDLSIPDRRGKNVTIPFLHGSLHRSKYYDERKIAFGIAVKTASALALETLMDSLRSNISGRDTKVLSQTREDGSIRTALASVDSDLQIERETATFLRLVLEFTLPFPFFRSNTLIADNTTTINANPTAMNVTNSGTAEEISPIITLTGPLENTVITNSTNGSVLSYTGVIASPRVVTLQTVDGEFSALDDLSANLIGNISHQGFSSMLVLNKGLNVLSIADDEATTGTVKISFYPPYF